MSDVSRELTEVRTVLSRARTAIRDLYQWHQQEESHQVDPDIDDMFIALQTTVDLLSRWERKRKPDGC